MSKARTLQVYRGTTSQNDAYTGSSGEITYDTEEKRLRVHDGTTAGGAKLAKYSEGIPSTGDVVIESSTGTNTWYRKYASGWVEQGGNKLSGTKLYTLPITMADTNYTLIASYGSDDTYVNNIKCIHTSATQITVKGFNGVGTEVNTWIGNWYVCGQAAA